MTRLCLPFLLLALTALADDKKKDKAPALPYRELTGRAEGFRFERQWRSYYWREDFTFVLRTDDGKAVRVISREPTPWNDLRLGTTFTGLKVDWKAKPRVRVIGVGGVDRTPAEFPGLKLDAAKTVTAFIVRVEADAGGKKALRDYYVNNWFHRWGADADRKVLAQYAGRGAPYTVYGFLGSNVAPLDKAGQALVEKHKGAYGGIIYHARVARAKNAVGYELQLLHLMGRHKKTAAYEVFHGDAKKLTKLDQKAPKKGTEARKRFTDVSAASGLRVAKDAKPHAVAVQDFDGDGKLDVLLVTFDAPHVRLFRNEGGLRFKDVTKGSGLESFQGTGSGAAVADFDRDGKLDVYLTSVRGGEGRLYRGKGDGTFADVSRRSGTLLKSPARSCAWSDVDGDGWPDLFVCCPDGANRLYRNNRGGTFTDSAEKAGVVLKGRHCLGCAFGDVDGDGRDDLFVTCYRSGVSALFRNKGAGAFEDVTKTAGLDRRASSVGCVLADVFNRGRLDLLVTTDSWLSGANYTEKELLQQKHTVEPNALYRNDGKGRFTLANAPALAFKSLSHDAVIEDLDHDGLPDIYVGVDAESGNRWATSKGGNPLYTRPGGQAWKEVAAAWGVKHEANCVCTAAADFDNDGDLDLLLVNFYSDPVLYRNETNDGSWLRVRAVGSKSSKDGVGAQVRVYRGKELVGYRAIQSGAGYCRCSPLEAHFGLGKKPAGEYAVEVTFPAGKKRVMKKVKSGQRLVVREEG